MTLETWAAFAAATAVLLVIPGPTILLVISYALGQGWRTAFPMAIGVATEPLVVAPLAVGVGLLAVLGFVVKYGEDFSRRVRPNTNAPA